MLRIVKKIGLILNKQQKIRVFVLGIMMVIGAFLESLGVGLILPLVSVITTPNLIEENKYAQFVCELFDLQSAKTFVIVLLIALIFVYFLKNIYLFIEYYAQYRFIANNRFSVQKQLMNTYLKRPYEYFLNAESGEIVRVVINDTMDTFALISTVLNFFTEVVVCVALIITIILTDFLMAVILAVLFGGLILLMGKLIKPKLRKAGLSRQKSLGEMNKWLLQSVSGIKEVKVEKREEYFLERFSAHGKSAISSEKINNVLAMVPRLSIEAFGISAMLGVIVFMMFNGREIDSLLPQLSVFAMAAVRLLPSVNRMSTALNTVVYQEPALDKMIEHLTAVDRWEKEQGNKNLVFDMDSKKQMGNKRIQSLGDKIQLKDVTYYYPNTEKPIFSSVNMMIPIGKSVGVVGASGSGKSTAIDILLGLLQPQKGQVLADNVDIREDYEGWLSCVGYIPQMIFMLDDTIRANIAFGITEDKIDEERVWEAIEEAHLTEFVKALPDGLDTVIGEKGVRISGGQRQRIGIARVLYTDPQVLIFDEATSALDSDTENAIMESINSMHGKKTLIIIAHRLQTIKECDIVYRVENGTIKEERN